MKFDGIFCREKCLGLKEEALLNKTFNKNLRVAEKTEPVEGGEWRISNKNEKNAFKVEEKVQFLT